MIRNLACNGLEWVSAVRPKNWGALRIESQQRHHGPRPAAPTVEDLERTIHWLKRAPVLPFQGASADSRAPLEVLN